MKKFKYLENRRLKFLGRVSRTIIVKVAKSFMNLDKSTLVKKEMQQILPYTSQEHALEKCMKTWAGGEGGVVMGTVVGNEITS